MGLAQAASLRASSVVRSPLCEIPACSQCCQEKQISSWPPFGLPRCQPLDHWSPPRQALLMRLLRGTSFDAVVCSCSRWRSAPDLTGQGCSPSQGSGCGAFQTEVGGPPRGKHHLWQGTSCSHRQATLPLPLPLSDGEIFAGLSPHPGCSHPARPSPTSHQLAGFTWDSVIAHLAAAPSPACICQAGTLHQAQAPPVRRIYAQQAGPGHTSSSAPGRVPPPPALPLVSAGSPQLPEANPTSVGWWGQSAVRQDHLADRMSGSSIKMRLP
ncbi:hypothetical protein NDU88_003099 [Pleurodeles waltl]|uniref:Uncharacterized protein n=1 Tax=Pleurodeles waltl TaxID=8319 RepID=A0AAV7P935_PLEWA|nr:hypothetical protein NDU88_003099 [Pleurodeles waltl]